MPLLTNRQLIMEVKVSGQLPEWLQAILEHHKLEKVSFSKYGKAYQLHQDNVNEVCYA